MVFLEPFGAELEPCTCSAWISDQRQRGNLLIIDLQKHIAFRAVIKNLVNLATSCLEQQEENGNGQERDRANVVLFLHDCVVCN